MSVSKRLDQVKQLCERVNTDINLSSECQSDTETETEPTVDSSRSPFVVDDVTIDSFLTRTPKKGDVGCKEIKQRPVGEANGGRDRTVRQNDNDSLPLPTLPRKHPLPPPRYNRSRSMETISPANSLHKQAQCKSHYLLLLGSQLSLHSLTF